MLPVAALASLWLQPVPGTRALPALLAPLALALPEPVANRARLTVLALTVLALTVLALTVLALTAQALTARATQHRRCHRWRMRSRIMRLGSRSTQATASHS
ncbi:MAG TPA: hypothetical protein QF520_00995 [SAR202 cluster bacterium]|nr:hypothetical protein [SAR202 cluster bacterium]HJO80968.1 hypothetical protein [SAR202 cluster bacterium]